MSIWERGSSISKVLPHVANPIIMEIVSAKTKEALRNTRTGSKNYDGAAQDDFFIVESLLSFREGEVEVKWVGFEKTTWEPEASIPGFLR